mmetsp:Transcript_16630/g.40010  ORF Transcript_16630/g.40010 Transcript_16630/m.40010 type:complete len:321 (-) Transcript_16630:13-975(-)
MANTRSALDVGGMEDGEEVDLGRNWAVFVADVLQDGVGRKQDSDFDAVIGAVRETERLDERQQRNVVADKVLWVSRVDQGPAFQLPSLASEQEHNSLLFLHVVMQEMLVHGFGLGSCEVLGQTEGPEIAERVQNVALVRAHALVLHLAKTLEEADVGRISAELSALQQPLCPPSRGIRKPHLAHARLGSALVEQRVPVEACDVVDDGVDDLGVDPVDQAPVLVVHGRQDARDVHAVVDALQNVPEVRHDFLLVHEHVCAELLEEVEARRKNDRQDPSMAGGVFVGAPERAEMKRHQELQNHLVHSSPPHHLAVRPRTPWN